MRITAAAASSLALVLAACGQPADTPPPADPATPPASGEPVPAPAPMPQPAPAEGEQGGTDSWRSIVSTEDAANLGRLDEAWRLARAEAEDGGFAAQVESLGPLVDPNAAQTGRVQPAPGNYRCRTIKLGSKSGGTLAYVAYPFFRCSVELTPGGDLILTKTTGSQRTRGLLYPDTDSRLVFVGAQAWGMDETGYPAYGQQHERDQVGVLERVGPNRWRLVVPWPCVESKLEILELVR